MIDYGTRALSWLDLTAIDSLIAIDWVAKSGEVSQNIVRRAKRAETLPLGPSGDTPLRALPDSLERENIARSYAFFTPKSMVKPRKPSYNGPQ